MKALAFSAFLLIFTAVPSVAATPHRLGDLRPAPAFDARAAGYHRVDVPLARALSGEDPIELARAMGLEVRGAHLGVQIVVEPASTGDVALWLESRGAEEVAHVGSVIEAFVTPGTLSELDEIPAVLWVRQPPIAAIPEPRLDGEPGPPLAFVTSEGVDETNVTEWHDDGFTGDGVKIGIIDIEAYGWEDLLGTDLPTADKFHYQRFGGGASSEDEVHGTAVAEIVHDMAPDAELYLAEIGSYNSNFRDAVQWMIDEGVRVVAMSISYFGVGPGDGTGPFQSEIDNFVQQANGVWAHSAGNYRDSHWQGQSLDDDENGWVEMAPGQEVAWLGSSASEGDSIRFSMQWNDWSVVNQDYSLHLFRLLDGEPVEVASTDRLQTGQPGQQPTEFLSFTAQEAGQYGVGIFRKSVTGLDDVEILSLDFSLADPVPEGSLSTPGDAAGAMNTAAVNTGSFNIRSFSSAGPTNGPGGSFEGGSTRPIIAAYDGVSVASYGRQVFGTSFACPHVAGAAGVVLSANPGWTGAQIRSFLENTAIDKGPVGMDNDFGWGRLNLGPSPLSTCAYDLDQISLEYSSGSNVAIVNVETEADCFWPAESHAEWLTVSTDHGNGPGRVIVIIDSNPGAARTGTLAIAGLTVTVNQQGADCSYSIAPTSQLFPAEGGDGTIAVTAGAGCPWTATSFSDWVRIEDGASGSGSGEVSYHVDPYDDAEQRQTNLSVAGLSFTVTQIGAVDPGYRTMVAGIAETAGAAGTRWKSNLAVMNPGGGPTSFNLVYRHQGGQVQETATLGNGIVEYQNVAADFFGMPDSAGLVEVQSEVPLIVTARTFNDAPDGTFGQLLPGVKASDGIAGSEIGVLSQLHSNSGFRTNIGFVNFGASGVTAGVRLFDGDGTFLGSELGEQVPAGGWHQVNRVFREADAGACTGCYALVEILDGEGPIWSYASVVDNGSGDPTTIPMEIMGSDDAEADLLVAGIAETAGAAGTRWKSNVAALNLSGDSVVGTVEYRYSGGVADADFELGDGELLEWENIAALLGAPDTAGAVAVTADGPLVVTARTFNDAATGSFGQFIPGLGISAWVDRNSPAVLTQIKRTDDFRTNVGFTNYSDAACDVEITLHGADGAQLGSPVTVTDIPPGGWKQQNRIFREAGVAECEVGYAFVGVLTEGCGVWAYASVVDNGSGDPTTIPVTVLFHIVP